jgi:hypothetical protein
MRVYAAPGYGLGTPEDQNFRRLSPKSRSIIAEELQHPDSHEAVHWILRQPDPERALADAITENIRQASGTATGLGDGLGKSFFKRLAKLHSRILHSIVRIHKKIDPGLHALTKKKRRDHSGAPILNKPTPAPTPAPAPDPGSSSFAPAPTPVPMPAPVPSSDPSYQMQTQGPVNYVQEQPPPDPSASAPTQDQSTAAPAPVPAAPAPVAPASTTPFTTGTDEMAGLPSASGYTLTVEGQTITNYPVDITQISSLVQSGTQPGDRFEISADGVGTGLRVRTTSGFISIPDSLRAQVTVMPRGQVLALLTQAASNVAAAGGPSGPTPVPPPSSGGSGMLWLLGAGGAAAVAAMSMGGKRR